VSPHYEIIALCNTSVRSAQAAIERYGLPSSTKAYGSPADLAKDTDVDLVVVNVRVDRHYSVAKPILEAGKDVFVEWPLGSNLAQAEEMLAIAKKTGCKTIVGLQARPSPHVQKVRQLVQSGAIGNLLSSTATLEIGFLDGVEPPGVTYLAEKASGGSILTILYGHMADPIYYSLGGLDELSALLTTRWSKSKLLHWDGSFDKMIDRETADHIMVQGTLSGSGAPFSIAVRAGKPFKNTPAFSWFIFGTKGEIRVTAPGNLALGTGGEKIELYDHEKDAVEVIDVEWPASVSSISPMAKNVGLLYELFATGGTEGFVSFEEAVHFHKIIETMEKSSAEKKTLAVPK